MKSVTANSRIFSSRTRGHGWIQRHFDSREKAITTPRVPRRPSPLDDFDVVWMRKDPPFNMDYIYSTYILSRVDESETHVINHPAGIRESNEKNVQP